MDLLRRFVSSSTLSSAPEFSAGGASRATTDDLRAADAKQRQIIQRTNTWKEKILPQWNENRATKKVRDLCYQGIPPSLRGKVWSLLIGNARKISDEYFLQLVAVADDLYTEAADHEQCLDSKYQLEQRRERLQSVDDVSYNGGEEGGGDEDEGDESSDSEQNPLHFTEHLRASVGDSGESEGTLDEGFICEDDLAITPPSCDDFLTLEELGRQDGLDGEYNTVLYAKHEEDDDDVDDMLHRAALFDITDNDIMKSTLSQISELQTGVSDVKTHLLGIERDIPRTFPTLAFFHDGGTLEMSLRRVLRAFVCLKTDIGYVQGMSFIVAMLLLYMDEVQAFRCFVNLIEKRGRIANGFYRLEHSAVKRFVGIFDSYFQERLPALKKHMTCEQISSEMYLIDWNLTLFSKSLSLESAARIWDCFLYDGESFVIRASLGILRTVATDIKRKSIEEILPILSHFPADIDTEKLITNIMKINISRSEFETRITTRVSDSNSPTQLSTSPVFLVR